MSRLAFLKRVGLATTTGLALGASLSSQRLLAADHRPAAAPQATGEGDGGRQEIPHWGDPYPKILNKASVVAAITDYVKRINTGGYHPDPQQVLAVRKSDRTAFLRKVERPVRQECYFFIEEEIFSKKGTTQLKPGSTPESHAAEIVEQVWDPLHIWVAYDLVRSSSAGFKKPFADTPNA